MVILTIKNKKKVKRSQNIIKNLYINIILL